jgi:hypothetical protein
MHLDHDSLRAAGLPEHCVEALYRALASQAAAFDRVVVGQVEQLRRVLHQQGGPQAAPALDRMEGLAPTVSIAWAQQLQGCVPFACR